MPFLCLFSRFESRTGHHFWGIFSRKSFIFYKKMRFLRFWPSFPPSFPQNCPTFFESLFCRKLYVSKISACGSALPSWTREASRSKRWAGFSPRPLSIPAFLDPGSRQKPSSLHICLSACAGLPAPWIKLQDAERRLPLHSFARPCARSDAAEIASIFQKIVFILLLFDFDYLPPLSPFDFDSLAFIFEIAYYIIFKQ